MNKNLKQCIPQCLKSLWYFFCFWKDIRCHYCKRLLDDNENNTIFCLRCLSQIGYLSISFHKNKFPIYALGRYDGIIRFIVTEKYRKQSFCYYGITEKIIDLYNLYTISFDIIVPLPKKFFNFIYQKQNQSYIIANIISRYFKKDIFNSLFYTTTITKSQSGKTTEARSQLSKNTFFVPHSCISQLTNKTILIVDDVYTTGSTIDAVITILTSCQVKKIIIFVIAKK